MLHPSRSLRSPLQDGRGGWSGRAEGEDSGLRVGWERAERGRGSTFGSSPCCCVTSGKLPALSGQQSIVCGSGKDSAHKVIHGEVRGCKWSLRTGLLVASTGGRGGGTGMVVMAATVVRWEAVMRSEDQGGEEPAAVVRGRGPFHLSVRSLGWGLWRGEGLEVTKKGEVSPGCVGTGRGPRRLIGAACTWTPGNTCPPQAMKSQDPGPDGLPHLTNASPWGGTAPAAPPCPPPCVLLQGPVLMRLLGNCFPAGHTRSRLMAPPWV